MGRMNLKLEAGLNRPGAAEGRSTAGSEQVYARAVTVERAAQENLYEDLICRWRRSRHETLEVAHGLSFFDRIKVPQMTGLRSRSHP